MGAARLPGQQPALRLHGIRTRSCVRRLTILISIGAGFGGDTVRSGDGQAHTL